MNPPLNLENYWISMPFNPHTSKAAFKNLPVHIEYDVFLYLKVLRHNDISANEQ